MNGDKATMDEKMVLEERITALNDTIKLLMRSQEAYAKNRVYEFAIKLQKYYDSLPGKTYTSLVSFHISQIIQDMFKEDTESDN